MISKIFSFKFEVNFALLFSVLTGIAYYASYNYEVAFCSFFGVPQEYINIDLSNIIPFTVKLILAVIFFLSGSYIIPKLDKHFSKKTRWVRIMVFHNAMAIYLNIALFAVFPYRNQTSYLALAVFIGANAIAFTKILTKKPFEPFKIEITDLPENTNEEKVYKYEAMIKHLQTYLLIFLMCLFMGTSTFIDLIAQKDAYAKTDFLVLKNDPDEVLIK